MNIAPSRRAIARYRAEEDSTSAAARAAHARRQELASILQSAANRIWALNSKDGI
jgi:hypothetical protein